MQSTTDLAQKGTDFDTEFAHVNFQQAFTALTAAGVKSQLSAVFPQHDNDFLQGDPAATVILTGPTRALVNDAMNALPSGENPWSAFMQMLVVFDRLAIADESLRICAGVTLGGGGKKNLMRQYAANRASAVPQAGAVRVSQQRLVIATIYDNVKGMVNVCARDGNFVAAFWTRLIDGIPDAIAQPTQAETKSAFMGALKMSTLCRTHIRDHKPMADFYSESHCELYFGAMFAKTVVEEFEAARAGNGLQAFLDALGNGPQMNRVGFSFGKSFTQQDNGSHTARGYFIRGIWRFKSAELRTLFGGVGNAQTRAFLDFLQFCSFIGSAIHAAHMDQQMQNLIDRGQGMNVVVRSLDRWRGRASKAVETQPSYGVHNALRLFQALINPNSGITLRQYGSCSILVGGAAAEGQVNVLVAGNANDAMGPQNIVAL